jgi:ribonuclease HI
MLPLLGCDEKTAPVRCEAQPPVVHNAVVADSAERTIVYTDGSCLGNPGRGGWAWVVPDGPWASGADPDTTNQRMEITAVLRALRELTGEGYPKVITVISDSNYVVKCFNDKWWQGWERRGWRNAQGKPVANQDLWQPLLALALDSAHEITFTWVKGHSGDHWNEVVDQLANRAATSGIGESGP